MKKMFILMLASVVIFTGCKDDVVNPPEVTTLEEYLIESNLDLPDILDGWIITASAVHSDLDSYYVIDTRSETYYNAGHIPGAVLADATTLLEVAEDCPIGKTIVVHCYKGIGAARYLTALRLSGHPTAKSLKFGMSAWGLSDAAEDAKYDQWTNATSDIALDYPEDWLLTSTEPAADVVYDYPVIVTDEIEDGAALLAERVQALLTDGYSYASAPDILTEREAYFINNKWDATSWEHYGHIAGAHRINDVGLANGGIQKYDPAQTCVTYCWTSQTSGVVTAYLTVLGYDAASLSNGANGLIWSNLESHKWNSTTGTPGENAPGNYDLEIVE
jgi:rhodanese-related sulfurtransferase